MPFPLHFDESNEQVLGYFVVDICKRLFAQWEQEFHGRSTELGEAAVPIRKMFVVRITVWWLGHQRVQHVIPARGGHESETNISLRTGRMFCPIIGRKQKNTETIIALGFLQFAP